MFSIVPGTPNGGGTTKPSSTTVNQTAYRPRNPLKNSRLSAGLVVGLAGCGLVFSGAKSRAEASGTPFDPELFSGGGADAPVLFSIPETSDQPPSGPLHFYSGPIQRGPGGVIGAVVGRFFETNGPVGFSLKAWLPHEAAPGSRRYTVDHIEGGLTLDVVPGAKLRFGHFDPLGGREEFVAIQQYAYFEFDPPARQMVLERLVSEGQSDAMTRHLLPRGAGAFSDLGVQVHDTFRDDARETAYAFMLGSGGEFGGREASFQPQLTGYWSTRWQLSEETEANEAFKFFAWGQWGERDVSAAGSGYTSTARYGLGTGLNLGRFRSSLEWIGADGLERTLDATATSRGLAWGWSWDAAYQIHPLCELAVRFDQVFREFGEAGGRLDTLTFGTQVLLGNDLRALLNYGLHWPEGMNAGSGSEARPEHLIAAQLAFSF